MSRLDSIKAKLHDDGCACGVGFDDVAWLLSHVERLREALTWTEKFYSTTLSENGCPCRRALGTRCPMHAALEADND
jgi:hypothetical protein